VEFASDSLRRAMNDEAVRISHDSRRSGLVEGEFKGSHSLRSATIGSTLDALLAGR
jgi:hypothetical protein